MTVVFLSGDLMSASRVEGAASRAGAAFNQVGSIDAAVNRCGADDVALIVVDLATTGLDVAALVGRLRGKWGGRPAVVAFGPHVHEAALAAAKSAGCDEVCTRGQFMARADEIIARHSTSRSLRNS